MKPLLILTIILSFASLAEAQIVPPVRGGTGASTTPSYGQVLVGNGAGIYTPIATSSLGISAGDGGSGGVGSSTNPFMATYYVATGTPTSTLPSLSVSTALSLLGEYITDLTTWVRGKIDAYLSGGEGVTYSSGAISFDCSEVEGTGIDCAGQDVTLDATGDWTGTFDGFQGAYYLANSFSTTSALAHLNTLQKGYFFSTTSADHWETQQTARTADDLTNNSIEDLSDVAAITENFGDLLSWNGSAWSDTPTSTLSINTDNLVEGSTNLFYTAARVNSLLNASSTQSFPLCSSGQIIEWNGSAWKCATDDTAAGDFATSSADFWLSTKDTDNLTEGDNLYYTDARVSSYITGSTTLAALINYWTKTGNNISYTGGTTTASAFSVTGGVSILGEYFTDFTTYVRSLFAGGTGVTLSSGDISFHCSEVEGTGINCSGESVTLDATGDWTGTFDGLEGSAYLANSFSTTSADAWISASTTQSFPLCSTGEIMEWNGSAWICADDDSGAGSTDTAFVTVCASGCDYTSIQTALDASEVDIRLKDETYAEQIDINTADVKITGAGNDSVISCNGVTQSPCVSATTTSKTIIRDLKIVESNLRYQGIGLDIGDNPNSTYQSIRVEGFATGTRMWDQASASFYSSLRDMTWFDNRSGIEFIGTQSNFNTIHNARCRQRAGFGGFCYFLSDVRGLGFYHINAEPSTAGTTTGMYIDASSRDNNIYNTWFENNGTGLVVASGATRNAFFGGSFTSNTTDYTDAGTATQFININDTGTLLQQFSASNFAGLLTAATGFVSQASSTIDSTLIVTGAGSMATVNTGHGANEVYAVGDGLAVSTNDLIFDCSDVVSAGLTCSGEDLQLNATGDWTGTFDGFEGSYYRANSFSTTSAAWFLANNTGAAFSTTSADHWITASTTIPKTTITNTWTKLQTFGTVAVTSGTSTNWFSSTASSTNLFASLVTLGNNIFKLIGNTVTALGTWDFSGATVTQHTYPAFTYSTSTAWTGTTTIPLGTAYVNEQWLGVECFTSGGSLAFRFTDGTNAMDWRAASSTPSRFALSTNNTFGPVAGIGEKRFAEVGSPASSPTYISCSVDKIVNN